MPDQSSSAGVFILSVTLLRGALDRLVGARRFSAASGAPAAGSAAAASAGAGAIHAHLRRKKCPQVGSMAQRRVHVVSGTGLPFALIANIIVYTPRV